MTVNTIKRDLFYDETYTLKLLNINEVLYEIPNGWFMQKYPISNLAIGAEYLECQIADDPDDGINLDDIIPLATAIQIGDERYKITQFYRPRGLTRQYLLRLESTGERVDA